MTLFERLDQRFHNMSTMLARFGIDPIEFAKQDYCNQFTSAIRNCQFCQHGDKCSHWLNASGETLDELPSFCPNKSRFEMIRDTLKG